MSHVSLDKRGKPVLDAITKEELERFRETLEAPRAPARGSRLRELLVTPEWFTRAACRGVGNEAFFPERGDPDALAEARKYCNRCPVRAECLADCLAQPRSGLEVGVWGGTSGNQRRKMLANGTSRPLRQEFCEYCKTERVPPQGYIYCSKRCRQAVANGRRPSRAA